ncbi:hypothetical protein Tco_0933486 [Tanacetum coccineum]
MEYSTEFLEPTWTKPNARARFSAIGQRLKTRRIMRSLERFVGEKVRIGINADREMDLSLEKPNKAVRRSSRYALNGVKNEKDNNIRVNSFTMKMEILLEPTSNKLMVEHAEYDESNTYVLERFNTTAGNPVKKILLKLNLSDHRLFKDGGGDFRYSDTTHLSRSVEVLKLKNFKKDATLKLSKSTNQERYEHVGPEVASSQDGKVTRWRRDCAWLMISRCSRSQCQIQVQGTSSIQKSMITTTYSQEKVKSTS